MLALGSLNFSDISVISWWSVLIVDETGVPGENRPAASQIYTLEIGSFMIINKLRSYILSNVYRNVVKSYIYIFLC